ncbi:MAG: hypothetical protein ACQEWV_25995 [Bacillota bacterium]
MSNLILKHYFLEEIERIRLEEALVKNNSENEEDILSLDDHSLIDLYNQNVKEQFIV